MSKKLTQAGLKKLQGEVSKKKELKLTIQGTEYTFLYDTTYSNSKIEKLIQELLEYVEYARNNNIADFNLYTFMILLVLKHFTDLPYKHDCSLKVRFESLIQTTNGLKDIICSTGKSVFEEVVSVAVIQEEIEKINAKVVTMNENIVKYVTELQEEVNVDGEGI